MWWYVKKKKKKLFLDKLAIFTQPKMQNVIQGHFKHAEIFLYLFVVKKNQLIYRKIQLNIKILKKEISTYTYRHNFSCYQILSKLLGKLCLHVVCFPQIEHYSPLGAVYLLVWCIYSKF